MQSLFEYLDYRQFLREFYDFQKEKDYYFSFQYISQHVGMDTSSIAKIFSGKRHIPINKIALFVTLCKLTGTKAEYFESLVYFNRSKSEKEIAVHYENLIKLRSVKGFKLTATQYKFYSKWYYTAIRAILDLRNYTDEYEEISKLLNPPIKIEQVKLAITFMHKNDIIYTDDDGYLKPTWNHISSGKIGDRQAVHSFQKEMMDMAKRSLNVHHKDERDISSITVSMDKDSMDKIKKIIEECRHSIRKTIDMDKHSNSIYQINFQVFPLTKEIP